MCKCGLDFGWFGQCLMSRFLDRKNLMSDSNTDVPSLQRPLQSSVPTSVMRPPPSSSSCTSCTSIIKMSMSSSTGRSILWEGRDYSTQHLRLLNLCSKKFPTHINAAARLWLDGTTHDTTCCYSEPDTGCTVQWCCNLLSQLWRTHWVVEYRESRSLIGLGIGLSQYGNHSSRKCRLCNKAKNVKSCFFGLWKM